MASSKAYDEIIDFIAAGSTPQEVIDFRLSAAAQARFNKLLLGAKNGRATADEKVELAHYLSAEHIMRLAKERAQIYVNGEA